jgi:hypothetical protein
MKIYKRFIAGLIITAYNDSNIEWVVSSKEYSEIRFNRNHFTMSEAIDFYTRIFSNCPTTATNGHTLRVLA